MKDLLLAFNILVFYMYGACPPLVVIFLYSCMLRGPSSVELLRDFHIEFAKKGLFHLSGGYQTLDASRPWIVYWILHALELLGALPDEETLNKYVRVCLLCVNIV